MRANPDSGDAMRLAASLLAASALLACGPEETTTPPPVVDAPHALPNFEDSKADNYVSTNAREYNLLGVAHVDLPEDFADLDNETKAKTLDDLVQRRLSTVAYAVRRHVDGIIDQVNDDADDHDIQYFTFFKRDANQAEPAVILEDGKRARFDFDVELVGSYYLMSKIAPEGGSKRTFEVEIDGGWMNEQVTSFDDLKIDSPAFTRQMIIEGKVVEARITIVHSDMVDPSEEEKLSDAMKASLATKDVVIYSGHAGPGAGFILDYQPRHEIRAGDFKTLDLADKYQIYVFDGCQTYRTYVDDLLENPNKSFDNLDIVTTVNTTPFSVGYQTIWEFVYWLTLTDGAGNHYPISWKDILRGLNTRNFNDVYYGVHGIDADPKLNPHAPDVACQPCGQDSDCGGGGNFCLGYAGGAACGVACTTDTACGEGYRCGRITADPDLWYLPKQCIRRTYVCPQ
jgi:hypothetical protein